MSLPTLAGCNNAHTTQALAPAPPERIYNKNNEITPPSQLIITNIPDNMVQSEIIYTSLSKNADKTKCNLNHRFDNDALIAYNWDRSRIALDIDGVGLDWDGFTDFEQVRLEYRLKFSPEKTNKEKCLYPSKWQGLIGSGYNELVIRKEDTAWGELREISKDLRKKVNSHF
ncbi:MAG: hypothetical protein OEY94_01395 [Alphaproteobacteria bacterium]|nr:hypothetical protein [Alphaproteobacteria bacterium]